MSRSLPRAHTQDHFADNSKLVKHGPNFRQQLHRTDTSVCEKEPQIWQNQIMCAWNLKFPNVDPNSWNLCHNESSSFKCKALIYGQYKIRQKNKWNNIIPLDWNIYHDSTSRITIENKNRTLYLNFVKLTTPGRQLSTSGLGPSL